MKISSGSSNLVGRSPKIEEAFFDAFGISFVEAIPPCPLQIRYRKIEKKYYIHKMVYACVHEHQPLNAKLRRF